MPKKSQVTIFIIIGLVIFMVFGLMFYATTVIRITKLKAQAEKIVEDLLETTALSYYVDLCIEKSLKEGLQLIGNQGGRIYHYQPGSLYKTPQRHIVFNDGQERYDVSYGIANDTSYQAVIPPKYPCKYGDAGGFPAYCGFINDPGIFLPLSGYFFAINNIPPLCAGQGTYCGVKSIEEQLESYVSNQTKECVEFESIIGINTTFNITEGDITTNITIGDSGITAVVDFPLLIKIGKYEPVIKILEFSAYTDNRLKMMYQWINDIVRNETKDLNHDIEFDSTDSPYYNPEFTLQKLTDIFKHDDVIIVTDTNPIFNLKGKQFSFKFAVENIYPALDYIPPVYPPRDRYDLIVVENHTINITARAYDLNEDNDGAVLMIEEYTYSGWKENYDAWFDFDACKIDPEDCSTNPENYVIIDENVAPPHNWTLSQDYKETKRVATYTPNHTDTGPHNITVKISDGDLEDYQIVRILVDDQVKAYANGTNKYGDISNYYASIEDPYLLEARYTDFINPGEISFRWFDKNENPPLGVVLYEGERPVIQIPTPADIKDMSDVFNVISLHEIELTVRSGGSSDIDLMNLNVKICLPHRSSSASFPYHNVTFDDAWGIYTNINDPFQADHTCCHSSDPQDPNWGTIRGTGTNCYESAMEYGCRGAVFTDVHTEAEENYGGPLPRPTVPIAGDYNDIISRDFTRKCSGDRGNICDGEGIDERQRHKECGNKAADEEETCTGCSRTTANTDATLGCKNFLQTTFEKEVLGSVTATGRCNKDYECSPGKGDDNYKQPGLFDCLATCDGDGNCDFAIDCECSIDCGVDPLCGNIPEDQLPKIVDACESNIQQECDTSCQKISTEICRNIPEVPSCNAAPNCDTRKPGNDRDNDWRCSDANGDPSNSVYVHQQCWCSGGCYVVYDECEENFGANAKCDEQTPYYKEENQGWCYKDDGCAEWCTTEIVNLRGGDFGDKWDACGCTGYDGKQCDSNFDGIGDGICNNDVCV